VLGRLLGTAGGGRAEGDSGWPRRPRRREMLPAAAVGDSCERRWFSFAISSSKLLAPCSANDGRFLSPRLAMAGKQEGGTGIPIHTGRTAHSVPSRRTLQHSSEATIHTGACAARGYVCARSRQGDRTGQKRP